MPKYKGVKKTKKYSPYQRRTKSRTVTTIAVPRNLPALMPPIMQTKLKYCDQIRLSNFTAGVPKVHEFVANGLYDPDSTGVGHQPRGFDQLMQFYGAYTVTKAVMRCSFNGHNSGISGCVAGITEDIVSGAPLDAKDLLEKPHLRWYQISRDTIKNETTYTSYPCRRLGLNNPGNLQLTQKGTSTANPVEKVYLKPFALYPSGTASMSDIDVTVSIEYTVQFSEQRVPTAS